MIKKKARPTNLEIIAMSDEPLQETLSDRAEFSTVNSRDDDRSLRNLVEDGRLVFQRSKLVTQLSKSIPRLMERATKVQIFDMSSFRFRRSHQS